MPEKIESPPLNYLCRLYDGEDLPTAAFRLDESVHFLLEFQQRAFAIHSESEAALPAVEGIKGISGCGVWWICKRSADAMTAWNADDIRLVGIEHRYWQKQGAVAGTKIEFVLKHLSDAFPSTSAAMTIVYP